MRTTGRHSSIALKPDAEIAARMDALSTTPDIHFAPLSRTLLTIRPDGTLELAPEATPRDVAEAIANAYSSLHREDRQTITTLTALLFECRAVLVGMGLRTTNRAFWKALDEALGLAPTDITRLQPEGESP